MPSGKLPISMFSKLFRSPKSDSSTREESLPEISIVNVLARHSWRAFLFKVTCLSNLRFLSGGTEGRAGSGGGSGDWIISTCGASWGSSSLVGGSGDAGTTNSEELEALEVAISIVEVEIAGVEVAVSAVVVAVSKVEAATGGLEVASWARDKIAGQPAKTQPVIKTSAKKNFGIFKNLVFHKLVNLALDIVWGCAFGELANHNSIISN